MSIKAADIENLVEPVITKERLKLCGIRVSASPRRPLIQIFIDYETDNITIDECAGVSKQVQDLIDMQPWAPLNYRIEVSSPGVDWPLSEPWQFHKNIGRLIKLNDQERTLEGRIVDVLAGGIIKLEHNGDVREMPLTELSGAKVVIELPKKPKVKRK